MYGKPFNPKKPFGTVFGDGRFAFDQDGQLYNAQKQPVDADGKPMALPPDHKPTPVEPDIPTTVTVSMPPADDPEDDVPEDEKPFNILAWAQGDEMLKATPYGTLRAEAARLLGDASKLTGGKEAIRKAVLAHYGIE